MISQLSCVSVTDIAECPMFTHHFAEAHLCLAGFPVGEDKADNLCAFSCVQGLNSGVCTQSASQKTHTAEKHRNINRPNAPPQIAYSELHPQ